MDPFSANSGQKVTCESSESFSWKVGPTCDDALPVMYRLPCDNAVQSDDVGMIQGAENLNLKGRCKVPLSNTPAYLRSS